MSEAQVVELIFWLTVLMIIGIASICSRNRQKEDENHMKAALGMNGVFVHSPQPGNVYGQPSPVYGQPSPIYGQSPSTFGTPQYNTQPYASPTMSPAPAYNAGPASYTQPPYGQKL